MAIGRFTPARFGDTRRGDTVRLSKKASRFGKRTSHISLPMRIGEYVLIELLGEGGMARVFRAKSLVSGKVLAFKLFDDVDEQRAVVSNYGYLKVNRLVHPNLVRTYAYSELNGQRYVTMELIAGNCLEKEVLRKGALELTEALSFIRQAAQGLRHIHDFGFIHCDVKPSNLMVTDAGYLRVIDFDLLQCRRISSMPSGFVAGTAQFMAPEQSEPGRLVDQRADIYSLGRTLHFLLTGGADRLTDLASFGVPASVAKLVRSMVAHDIQKRPRSMGAVLALLPSLSEFTKSKRTSNSTRRTLPFVHSVPTVNYRFDTADTKAVSRRD